MCVTNRAHIFLSSELQRRKGRRPYTYIQMMQNTAGMKYTRKSAEKHRNAQYRVVIATHTINRGEKVKIRAQIT